MIQRPLVLSALLTALLAVSAASARTLTTFSNKNILMHRSQQSNAALEYTSWNGHVYGMLPATMHSNLQVAPFYQASMRKKDLGRYFGMGNGSDTFKFDRVNTYSDVAKIAGAEVDAPLIIHDIIGGAGGTPYTASANVKLAPAQEQYGARLDFFQELNTPFTDLFIRVSTTAVHVQNNMKLALSNVTEAGNNVKLSISDFFSGAGSNAQQAALSKARMAGSRSATGLADIEVSLGRKFLHSARGHAFFSIDATIPTGNRVQADYLFAPTYGNGHHFGLGASFDGGLDVWHNHVGSIRFNAVARYKYLFEGNEERTMSLKTGAHGTTGLQNNMSKYFLVGRVNAPAGSPLLPLANVSSTSVAVKPGHQLDLLAALSFQASKFTFDIGYNPFWRDEESVHVRNFAADGKYAVADRNFNAAGADVFRRTTATAYREGNELVLADFDLDGISTPTLLSHKLFAGGSYSWKAYGSTQMSLGLGTSYELATSNADMEQYAFWGKFNISF